MNNSENVCSLDTEISSVIVIELVLKIDDNMESTEEIATLNSGVIQNTLSTPNMHSEDVHALESVETESNLDHADKVINLDLKASEKHVLTTNNSSEETYDLVVIDQIYNETSTTSNLSVNLKCINTLWPNYGLTNMFINP